MRLFSITFIIAGLIAFAIANEQMNNCTDDGCSDFYDGKQDETPAPIVKILLFEPILKVIVNSIIDIRNKSNKELLPQFLTNHRLPIADQYTSKLMRA